MIQDSELIWRVRGYPWRVVIGHTRQPNPDEMRHWLEDNFHPHAWVRINHQATAFALHDDAVAFAMTWVDT